MDTGDGSSCQKHKFQAGIVSHGKERGRLDTKSPNLYSIYPPVCPCRGTRRNFAKMFAL